MIAEQLQAARAAHWRQNQSPLLTLDDAQSWFQQHPLCLYLPRHAQLPAPAPSFVEACIGSRQTMPGGEAQEQARALVIRLVASHTVVPLNLFGTVSEQPDFLAHIDALPFVISLRADADWKHAPQKSSGHAVSPLVLELWKALEKDGSLTAAEARQVLGRELTEAAVLRGLCELWQTLRISPAFPGEGEPARWEMLRLHHRTALATAGNTGQVTAISLLVSMYLQSVYAASSDEIEIFLSPVASRSRVREAVRGLAATRQIQSLSMDAQTYYFLEGGLPEFAELPAAAAAEPLPATSEPRRPRPAPRKVQAQRPQDSMRPAGGDRPPAPRAEPIFRRPKPVAPPPVVRPERAAAGPVDKSPARPAWKPAAKPYAAKPYGQRRDAGSRGRGGPPSSFPPKRPYSPRGAQGSQPGGAEAFPRARTPYARPGAPGAGSDGSNRPQARSNARPGGKRPGAWTGGAKREAPKPWALPGRKSDSPVRPPRPGGRSDAPFQRRDRGVTGPDDASRGRPDRGADRPRRSPGPEGANRATGFSAGRSGYRKDERPRSAGRPAARPAGTGATTRGARPGGRPDERGPQRRPDRPRTPQAGAPARPFTRSSSPRPDRPRAAQAGASARPYTRSSGPSRGVGPERPGPRAGAPARPFTRSSGPPRGDRSAPPRGAGQSAPSDRPRPGRSSFPSSRPRSGGSAPGGRGPKPPFVPGGPSRKPGKPPANFRSRKPDKKKPGA